ncbi:MAG TPA: PilN domain-containing protein [Myxococcaceae bacterium]|nr:PilN domain-containing protein [Myxococcaceae bacterium]
MMIKINLLPVRQVKKREAGKQILVLYAVLLLGALLGNWFWWSSRDDAKAELANKVRATDAKIKELEKIIGEVNNINNRKKELEEKLAVLNELRKGRSGPVRILDALAEATPKKVWLREFDEKGGQVKLSGTAFSHEDVAELMRGLQSVVWTPKGMGRLVERRRDSKTSRVELLGQDGAIEDFNSTEVGMFFTGVELKNAAQKEIKAEGGYASKQVEFQLTLGTQYTL